MISHCICICISINICICVCICRVSSLVTQMVKNLPFMQETWVWSLGQEDPLEEGMATHSSIPAWRIPMDGGAWRLSFMGSQRVGHDWAYTFIQIASYHIFFIHSSTDGPLGCFLILAVENHAAVNMGMHPIHILFSLDIYPEVELLDHIATPFLVFWGNSIIFFHSGHISFHSYQQCTEPPFSPYPHQHLSLVFWW